LGHLQAQQPWQVQEPCADEGSENGLADRWISFWQGVETKRCRVNTWPDPFVIPDRELVRAPFKMMADNGWKLQTTLSDHLFTDGANELTYAGQLKLRWILTQIPPHRRRIYVMEGRTRDDTGARVASVYKHLAGIAPGGIPYPVLVTHIAPRGGEGEYLNSVDRLYKAALPAPSLPEIGTAGGGSETSDSGGSP
jgi:hypothetical protein